MSDYDAVLRGRPVDGAHARCALRQHLSRARSAFSLPESNTYAGLSVAL